MEVVKHTRQVVKRFSIMIMIGCGIFFQLASNSTVAQSVTAQKLVVKTEVTQAAISKSATSKSAALESADLKNADLKNKVSEKENQPESLSAQAIQQQWQAQIAARQSMTALELNANLLSRRQSASGGKPNYQNVSYFNRKIKNLENKLNYFSTNPVKINDTQIQSLLNSYDDLMAAHLMRNESYQIQLSKLQNVNGGAVFIEQLQQSQQNYQEKMSAILTPLKPLINEYRKALSADTSTDKNALTHPSNTQLQSVINQTRQLLNAEISSPAVRILRSQLPYRQAVFARRSPGSTVSIVPSYESDDLPTSEDLHSTSEAPLSEAILLKAQALEHDYIKIYDFVHNQIKTEWYVGASKGAEGTLLQLSGNDVDQASLLIALFRASGLASRYVHGVVELTVESVNANLGLTTAEQAIAVLDAAGVAYSTVVRGGKVAAFKLEYTWVSAYVPYNNYRGAVVDRSGEQWLPLMPALKAYQVKPASDLIDKAAINIDASINHYLASRQMTSIHSQLNETINYYLSAHPEEATYEEQLGAIEIKPSQIGLIPNTLPVSVVAVDSEEPELSDQFKQKVRFVARGGVNDNDAILMDKTIALSQLINRRVTLSYMPATIDDHDLTNLYGGLDLVPAYLINLRPEIKLNGRKLLVAENAIGAGVLHRFDVELISPAGKALLKHQLLSGSYHAITIATGEKSFPLLTDDPADTEFTGARILSDVGLEYNKRWTAAEEEFAKLLNVAVVRPLPSFNLVSNEMKVETLFGEPQQLQWNAVTLDAGFRMAYPLARQTSDQQFSENISPAQAKQKNKDFIRLSALHGSTLEHEIFEDLFKVDSISADKGIQIANSNNQPVLTINSTNASSQLPLLVHPANVIQDVQNWVAQGFEVTIPQTMVTHNAWSGSVWIVNDLNGGAGYFIAGGLAGGSTTLVGSDWILDWLQQALDAVNSPEPNNNPDAVYSIVKYIDPGYIKGTVGKPLERQFIVQVKDKKGIPVQGAEVHFKTTGGGSLDNDRVFSDQYGLARVTLTLGQSTSVNPLYQRQNQGDQYLSKTGLNSVSASINGAEPVSLSQPFFALAFADEAVSLSSLNPPDDFIGSGDTVAGALSILALDQYGNPVSNVDVSASMTAEYNPCSQYQPEEADIQPLPSVQPGQLMIGEEKKANLNFKTTHQPTGLLVVLGKTESTRYPVEIKGAGTTLNYPFEAEQSCNADLWGIGYSGFYIRNANDKSVIAAKPGEQVKVPIKTRYTYFSYSPHPENIQRKTLPGQGKFVADNGASMTPAYLDGELFSSKITVGSTPGVHNVYLEVTVLEDLLGRLIQKDYVARSGQQTPTKVYAVAAKIDSVIDPTSGTSGMLLNRYNTSVSDTTVQYSILPAAYEALSVSVDILKDGELYTSLIGSSLSNSGEVNLPQGFYYDPDAQYQMQLVLNRNSDFEIKSERQALPIYSPIIKYFSQREELNPDLMLNNFSSLLRIGAEFDAVNNRSCLTSGLYEFEINVEAKMTLDIDGKKLVENVVYPKGRHSVEIPLGLLGHGFYQTKLTAEATASGVIEEKIGELVVSISNTNTLPVGHTLVKGVNVSNGNLSVSSTDLSIPGRGQALEFRRYYNSNNNGIPGALGVGWNFNYHAQLHITACGEIVLLGGTGGGNRFAADDNGQLKPLKGYHGTLINNVEDHSFDFYAKDGTRYHYRNYGRKNWDLEYIEDTNNNRIELTYDTNSAGTAKLLAVTGPNGRAIRLSYEYQLFVSGVKSKRLEVITQIDFEGGISVQYEYDNFGNLVSVNRNSGARVEQYAYAVDAPVSRHKLLTYTDPNGYDYTYTYQDQVIQFNIDNTTGLTFPYSLITKVTEPEVGSTEFTYNFDSFTTQVTNPRQLDTDYTYNQYGAVVNVAKPIGSMQTEWLTDDVLIASTTDANGHKISYTYDEHGNRLTENKLLEVTTETTYYPPSKFIVGDGKAIKNRIKSITDPNGKSTTFDYDSRGNLVLVKNPDGGQIKHSYNSFGDKRSTTDTNGSITRFQYDSYGNVTQITDALNNITKTERNVLGLPLSVTDANQKKTLNTFDELQRLIAREDPSLEKGITRYTYDANGNKLTETDANQRTTTYAYDKANRLIKVTNATPEKDYQEFTYDGMGNKITETDFNLNTTTYTYDDNDRLTKVEQPESRTMSYTYDLVGNKLSETIGSQTTSYVYDELNRLTTINAPLESNASYTYDKVGNLLTQTDALDRETVFKYDSMNRLILKTEPLQRITQFVYDFNGNKVSETDANNGKRQWGYDAINRVVKVTDANGDVSSTIYDPVGNVTRVIDARLNATQFEYDGLNRRIKSIDANDVETTYVYDKVGNLLETHLANTNVIKNTYDELNRLTKSEDNLGTLTTKTYDKNSNLKTETDANGNQTVNVYDKLNRLVEQQLPENRIVKVSYDIYNNKTSDTDANKNVTGYEYDLLNRLVKTTYADLTTSEMTYDLVGNPLTQVDQRKNTTQFEYDALNQRTKVIDPLLQETSSTYDKVGNKLTDVDKRGTVTAYTYDKENRLLTTTKDGLKLLSVEYDAVGNKAFETDANGNRSAYIYSRLNQLTQQSHPLAAISRFTYDEMGNRVSAIDPESRESTFSYDLRNRLTKETNGNLETTEYTYDGNGNRLTKKLPKENTWTYVYDKASRLASMTAPDIGVTEYTYDANSNRLTQKDALLNTTTFVYDELNRRASMTYPGDISVGYEYDDNGNLIELTDANGKIITYVYDKLNRKTQTNYPASDNPSANDIVKMVYGYDKNNNLTSVTETFHTDGSSSANVRTTSHQYDNFDRQTSVTNGDGKTISYTYDSNGNRKTVKDADDKVTRYEYDALNRAVNVANGQGVTEYTYDRSSRQTQVSYPNGTQSQTTYDGAGRTKSIRNLQNASVISQFDYVLDANGNREQQTETQGALVEVTDYHYDENDRLTQTDISVAGSVIETTQLTYDKNYNRLTELKTANGQTVINKTFVYNSRNQVTQVTDNLDTNQSATYTYDNNGNRIKKQSISQTENYAYDVRDQLKEITQGGSSIGQFLYDYQGLRVAKTTVENNISTTKRYVYDDQSVLMQTDADGNTLSKYDYGSNRLLSLTHQSEGAQFYLFDALGSPVNLTKTDGTVQASYQYDAFGNARSQTGTSANVFGFTGHEKDEESGLYYFKARYYDPTLGQFLTQDAFEGMSDLPPSLHKYVYAYGNPTVYTDPTGHLNVVGEGELSNFYHSAMRGSEHSIASSDFENMINQQGLGNEIETRWENNSLNLNSPGTRTRVLSKVGTAIMARLIMASSTDADILPSTIVSVEEGETTAEARASIESLVGDGQLGSLLGSIDQYRAGNRRIIDGTPIVSAKEHARARAQNNIFHRYTEILKMMPHESPITKFIAGTIDDIVTSRNLVVSNGIPRDLRTQANKTLIAAALSADIPFLRVGRGVSNKVDVPNLTENGTLTNRIPTDPAVLQTTPRTLVQDGSGRYWLQGANGKRITPSGSYDFVTLPDGTIRVARQNTNPDFSTHLGLSKGGEVNYAGSITFPNNTTSSRGTLTQWTNNSGHYQPPVFLNKNANLPIELFDAH
ncbi:RHS repeat-associated core domain-containing protein [Aliikangiella sp. IMCC44359]|uniref:RHS repeat-associated core domain-containing protein n=1 Tax=Aliikangiella sp. IMCC44359 TaxID=3459125 RepID=UPI00403ABDEB